MRTLEMPAMERSAGAMPAPAPGAPSSERASHGPVVPMPVMMVGAEANEPAVVVAHDLVEPWIANRNARNAANAPVPVQAQTADPFPAQPLGSYECYVAPSSREGVDDETQVSLHGLKTKRRWKTRIALAVLAVAATVAFAHRATLRAPADLADAQLMVRAATAHVASSVVRDVSLTRSRVSPSAIVPDPETGVDRLAR